MHTSSHPLVLILLGAPGSGKGTQAALIQEKFRLPHISTGDILRREIRSQTDLGKLAKGFIDQGELVPDHLVLDILFKRLQDPDCKKGYVLDGVPRTVPQAQALSSFFEGNVIPIVINFSLPQEELLERLSLRISCLQCGYPYHLLYSPPKYPSICDRCQGTLAQRPDDKREVVLNRLKVYCNQTEPLLDFYNKLNQLHTIDCSQKNRQEIFEELSHFFD